MSTFTSQKPDWANLEIESDDLDFIYSLLLEKEIPMTAPELIKSIVSERIKAYKKNTIDKINADDSLYRPNKSYSVGDLISFPMNGGKQGVVEDIRDGSNPDDGSFKVIRVKLDDGTEKEFAAELPDHKLNTFDYSNADKESVDPDYVMKKYGRQLSRKLTGVLKENEDLVVIASHWFPQALLAEVNPGFLNLAEAVLEAEEGRPVPTSEILEQIEYPVDSNEKLTEFSFNYAMQQDDRFAEVGPIGVVLWTLKELQPEDVRKTPMTLKFTDIRMNPEISDFDMLSGTNLFDELEEELLAEPEEAPDSFDVCISYPHWKAGTLPLIGQLRSIFPTALETDNVTFIFHDRKGKEDFPGWVILSKNYVSGLKQWYRKNGIIPGSKFRVSRGNDNTQINIDLIPPRAGREWIRTFCVNEKNRFIFETRQQRITTDYDDRLVIYVENSPQLDTFWESNNRSELNVRKQIDLVFKELSKDNPQGIIHFQELYGAVNMLRRVPPRLLYSLLTSSENIQQIDREYFRITEPEEA